MKAELSLPCADDIQDSRDLDTLLQGLKGVPEWDENLFNTLDYLYRHRLLRLLCGQASGAHLRAYRDHLSAVLDILGSEVAKMNPTVIGRWAAYVDLVDSQLAVNRRRPSETLLGRTHVREILERVLDGRVRTQRDIQTQLQLKEANASRILKLMEQAQLIRRRKIGRENRIEVGAMAESARVERRTVPRGLDYLVARG